MSQLELVDATHDLETFFSQLHLCTDKLSLTHGLHPYPAKFIPHIPRQLIAHYSSSADVVYDPMCGSGTTLVEAIISGRMAIGGDVNPIAVLVSRAKTTNLDADAMHEIADCVRDLHTLRACAATGSNLPEARVPDFHNRDKWFLPHVSRELAVARDRIMLLRAPAARALALCSLSAVIVPLSNQESETRWCARERPIPAGTALDMLATKVTKNARSVRELSQLHPEACTVLCEDAKRSSLADQSVDLVVTSPPYMNSHDYYLYNKLRLFWLGYEVGPVQRAEIGSRHRHSDLGEAAQIYFDEMRAVLGEVKRTLRFGSHAIFIVADAVVRGRLYDMASEYRELATSVGLSYVESHAFDHRRFNAAFQAGFGTSYTKRTHVLVLQRS